MSNIILTLTSSIVTFKFCCIILRRGRKLGVLGKLGNLRESVFRGFQLQVFRFVLYPCKTENSELKTSEFSLRHYNQLTPRFSNSEFSILHYTQTENSELKTSEVSLRFTRTTIFLLNCVTYSNSEFFQLRGFVFALPYIPNRKLGDGKPLEFDQTA